VASLSVDEGDHFNDSGRLYNTLEGYIDVVQDEGSLRSLDDSSPTLNHADKEGLMSLHKLSKCIANAISSETFLRKKVFLTKAKYKQTNHHQITPIQDLLPEERTHHNKQTSHGYATNLGNQYQHKLTDTDILGLTPGPLVVRPQRDWPRLVLDTNDPLRNIDVALEHDIDEMISSINHTKLYSTSTASLFDEGNDCQRKVPLPLKPPKRRFGIGHHPLKSSIPCRQFSGAPNTVSETGSSEKTFSRQLSGAMKHLTLGPTSLKRSTTSNWGRQARYPDNLMPNKAHFKSVLPSVESTIQRGGVHIQEAVTKVKKAIRVKTPEERRRESLKKSIVYVGISDQSPGMPPISGVETSR
jgi:hypothetical protein